MKTVRIFSVLLIGMMAFIPVCADDLTPEQTAFRSEVLQFILEEGFSPYIDDDGDVSFKKEGVLYWVTVASSNPFYVEIHRAGVNFDSPNVTKMYRATSHGNGTIRCAKAWVVNDAHIYFSVEVYMKDIDQFRRCFYRNVSALEAIKEAVVKYYNEN